MREIVDKVGRAFAGRRLLFAYSLVAALYALLPWTVTYQPTTDGGAHVYNAWILHGLLTGSAPPRIVEHFEVNARPFPNWLGHAAMALLMTVTTPSAAEKLLVSAYVLLFLSGAWRLTSTSEADERWHVFLAFPFVYNKLFQRGFYNFSLGLALMLWVLSFWWRHRARLAWHQALLLNLLLLLCWFSHPLPFALSLLGIGLLWLTALRGIAWRQRLWQVLALTPQLVLPAWYVARGSTAGARGSWGWERLLAFFGQLEVLVGFDRLQRWPFVALALLFATLLVRTLWVRGAPGAPRRPQDAFLLLAFAAFAVYAFAPTNLASGSQIKQRLSLAPWLFLLPAFSTRLRPRARKLASAAGVLLGLLHFGVLLYWYDLRGDEVTTYVRGLATVPAGAGVVPLHFERRQPTHTLSHAVGYAAVAKGLVYLDDYEAKFDYFPVRFRRSAKLPRMGLATRLATRYQVARNQARVDAVYTWGMPEVEPVRTQLQRSYRLADRAGKGELWLRSAPSFDLPSSAGQPPTARGKKGFPRRARPRPQRERGGAAS